LAAGASVVRHDSEPQELHSLLRNARILLQQHRRMSAYPDEERCVQCHRLSLTLHRPSTPTWVQVTLDHGCVAATGRILRSHQPSVCGTPISIWLKANPSVLPDESCPADACKSKQLARSHQIPHQIPEVVRWLAETLTRKRHVAQEG
jgi:hypothetical protein